MARAAGAGDEDVTLSRQRHRTHHGEAVDDEADVDGEVVAALGVLARAVERVDDPHPGRGGSVRPVGGGAAFLGQDRILGTGLVEGRHDELVGPAVAFGSERSGVVEAHGPTELQQGPARLLGDAGGQLVVVESRQFRT